MASSPQSRSAIIGAASRATNACTLASARGIAGIDAVGNPAREREASRADRQRRQQRVIEAAEPHAHHQHDRQPELGRDVEHVMVRVERNQRAAGTFDDDHIGARGEPRVGGDNVGNDDRPVRRRRRRREARSAVRMQTD
jgi:hypothetical protein